MVTKVSREGLGFWHLCTCAVAVLLFTCVGSVSCTMLVAATRWCCSVEELCTEVTTTEVLVSPGECAKGSPPGFPAVPFSSTIPSIALGCDPLQEQQLQLQLHLHLFKNEFHIINHGFKNQCCYKLKIFMSFTFQIIIYNINPYAVIPANILKF